MSEDNRSAVESAVQELLKGSEALELNYEPIGENSSSLSERLSHMGFSSSSISAAITNSSKSASMSELLDWLCLHVPEDELPRSMASRK